MRALDYYEPVLGLPDTLKAKKFDAVRESIANRASKLADEQGLVVSFDIQAPLNALKAQEPTKWRQLREEDTAADQSYPILNASVVEGFRQEVRAEMVPLIRETLPSLAKTNKAAPPDDWNRA